MKLGFRLVLNTNKFLCVAVCDLPINNFIIIYFKHTYIHRNWHNVYSSLAVLNKVYDRQILF